MPAVPLLTPLFSVTDPVRLPVIVEVSLAPLMVMLIDLVVPSMLAAVKVSVSVPPVLSACTEALLSFSV